MQTPLQITFRHMETSEALEANIREKAADLEKVYDNITSCRVVVETHHKHHRQGNLFHIRVDVNVPGSTLVVKREPDQHHAHEDVYVAVRDAFDAMRRQLEDYNRRQRGDIKTHEAPPHGRIIKLTPEENYGLIETSDGREIYFHRNSVTNAGFDALEVGNEVRFVEVAGDQGPQASTVTLQGKHHIAG